MLENLSGDEGLPSRELLDDLRTLCGLTTQQIDELGAAFSELSEETVDEASVSSMLKRLRAAAMDPVKLHSTVKVAVFIWERWARKGLSKEQVIGDLKSIGITQQQQQNIAPLLDVMERKIDGLRRYQALQAALGSGTPRLESAVCVIDARAIFKGQRHDGQLGDGQPYFAFDRFVPVVLLELVSELNEEKRTHCFVLTEKQLGELSGVLARAGRRLHAVKERLSLGVDGPRGAGE